MIKDSYRKAIIKYCDACETRLKSLQSKGYIKDIDVVETRQKNEADIKRFLEEDEAYGRLLLSLEQIQREDSGYVSLTDLARKENSDNPSYIIQSWLRSKNTIEFLRLWERDNNHDFDNEACDKLLDALKSASYTLTAKQWIEKTHAIGLVSKQGKGGGTFAHEDIALDFKMWLEPECRYGFVKSLIRKTFS